MFALGFNLGVFTMVLINDPVLWLSCICGEMVSVLASSAVDRRFEPRWITLKTMKLISVASSLSMQRSGERADWLARNQNNVSEWSDMSTHGLLFQ